MGLRVHDNLFSNESVNQYYKLDQRIFNSAELVTTFTIRRNKVHPQLGPTRNVFWRGATIIRINV